MLHLPESGQRVFEVAIYNQEVKELVEQEMSHSFFDDQWADVQISDVVARDEAEARTLIRERFPAKEGFVIKKIRASRF